MGLSDFAVRYEHLDEGQPGAVGHLATLPSSEYDTGARRMCSLMTTTPVGSASAGTESPSATIIRRMG